MATLVSQQVSVLGTTLTQTAAAGGGDKVTPGTTLIVRNGGGSPITVTVVVPGNTKFGVAAPDYTFVVSNGAMAAIGPLPFELADPADSYLISITYSGVTTVTVSPITV
jgi:hypothetical protein